MVNSKNRKKRYKQAAMWYTKRSFIDFGEKIKPNLFHPGIVNYPKIMI